MRPVSALNFPRIEAPPQAEPASQEASLASWVVGRVEAPRLAAAPFASLDLRPGNEPDAGKIARIEEAARAEGLAAGKAEGLAAGKAEGLKKGRAEARAEVEAAKAALAAATESLVRARAQIAEGLELDMAEIALGLAAALAGGALAVEPARVAELARQAVSILAEADSITLRASEDVAPFLREASASLQAAGAGQTVTVAVDPALEAGGCVVESDLARVDLRVSQRIAEARELVASARGEG